MKLYEYCIDDCKNCNIENCKYREDEDDDYWEDSNYSYCDRINVHNNPTKDTKSKRSIT